MNTKNIIRSMKSFFLAAVLLTFCMIAPSQEKTILSGRIINSKTTKTRLRIIYSNDYGFRDSIVDLTADLINGNFTFIVDKPLQSPCSTRLFVDNISCPLILNQGDSINVKISYIDTITNIRFTGKGAGKCTFMRLSLKKEMPAGKYLKSSSPPDEAYARLNEIKKAKYALLDSIRKKQPIDDICYNYFSNQIAYEYGSSLLRLTIACTLSSQTPKYMLAEASKLKPFDDENLRYDSYYSFLTEYITWKCVSEKINENEAVSKYLDKRTRECYILNSLESGHFYSMEPEISKDIVQQLKKISQRKSIIARYDSLVSRNEILTRKYVPSEPVPFKVTKPEKVIIEGIADGFIPGKSIRNLIEVSVSNILTNVPCQYTAVINNDCSFRLEFPMYYAENINIWYTSEHSVYAGPGDHLYLILHLQGPILFFGANASVNYLISQYNSSKNKYLGALYNLQTNPEKPGLDSSLMHEANYYEKEKTFTKNFLNIHKQNKAFEKWVTLRNENQHLLNNSQIHLFNRDTTGKQEYLKKLCGAVNEPDSCIALSTKNFIDWVATKDMLLLEKYNKEHSQKNDSNSTSKKISKIINAEIRRTVKDYLARHDEIASIVRDSVSKAVDSLDNLSLKFSKTIQAFLLKKKNKNLTDSIKKHLQPLLMTYVQEENRTMDYLYSYPKGFMRDMLLCRRIALNAKFPNFSPSSIEDISPLISDPLWISLLKEEIEKNSSLSTVPADSGINIIEPSCSGERLFHDILAGNAGKNIYFEMESYWDADNVNIYTKSYKKLLSQIAPSHVELVFMIQKNDFSNISQVKASIARMKLPGHFYLLNKDQFRYYQTRFLKNDSRFVLATDGGINVIKNAKDPSDERLITRLKYLAQGENDQEEQ